MHLVRDLSYIYQKNYKEKVKKGEKKKIIKRKILRHVIM
jgi:hypothetical protein